MSLAQILHRVAEGQHLSVDEADQAMSMMLDGRAGASLVGGVLVALKMKGESADELAGFARALRARATFIDAGCEVIDTCGTGGDGSGTFNVSTAAALVMAACGAHVSKHGNRSVSSQTGSADVLEALGIPIQLPPAEAARAIREHGFAFLFAPDFQPAVRNVMPVRRELKIRTAFNLLGPLVNPGRAAAQLIGAPSPETARLIAEALWKLGTTKRSYVVHGRDGLDEISISGPTDVYEVTPVQVTHHVWSPADFGLRESAPETLQGGDAACNARIINDIFNGEAGSARDIVLTNAAAGLHAGGLVATLKEGVERSAQAIDSGAVRCKLSELRAR
jgi:anthranilate phosphoribosyltransferase